MMKSGSLSMAKTVQSKDGDSTSSASRSVQPVRMGPETYLNLLRRTVQRAVCDGCGPSAEGIAAELARMLPHQRASAVMGMQQTLGNGYVGRLAVQAKLKLGPAGDKYEQEADRVAQRVVETIATSEEGTDQKATQQSEDRSAMKTLERAPKPDDCLTLGSDIRRSPLFSFTPAKCAFPVLQRYVNVGLYEGALGFDHIGIGVNTENMSGFSPVAGSGQDAEAGSWVDGEVKEDRGLIESLVIKTNSEQEAKIQGAINRSTSTPPMFNLYQHNCAHQAAEMLNSGGLNVRSSQIPRTFFAGLKSNSGWKENREEPAQMKYSIGSFVEGGIDTDLESAIHRERSGGRPLPEGVRQLMERAFGADFGGVRVHADVEADSLNRSLQARAFTTGQDVFFRQGEYRPTSSEGQKLLAHELTHVVQQNGGVVQRYVLKHKDETKDDYIHKAAGYLDRDVQYAKEIIDTDPLLKSVKYGEGSYLDRWVKTFTEFTTTGEVPVFFFASYGYAVETLASPFFLGRNFDGYKVNDQVSHGHTRPDFVISRGGDEIAWLDITSSASQGHIFSKQGSGWKTRPYVAEILYEMPNPKNFAQTASGKLTEDQLKALNKAQEDQALRMFTFDRGMKKMALLLGEAYRKAYEEKGQLSKEEVKKITTDTCRLHLNGYVAGGVKPSWAAGVLASIIDIEVGGSISSGNDWARWAFTNTNIDRQSGRALLYQFGQSV